MPIIKIKGKNSLKGNVTISGAKNAVLPLLAAAVLCDGESVFYNCPDLSDVDTSIEILRHLGIDASFNSGVVKVDGRVPANSEIPERMMRKMRSSIVFVGSLLSRKKKTTVSYPGGCELGPRPIDIHIDSLKMLGAECTERHGLLEFKVREELVGTEIDLKTQSVGATENIILASVLARGTTVINNAAREPEIEDLALFLNKAGANIKGIGSNTIIIKGVEKLNGVTYTVMPDRIEASTFMAAAAVTSGDLTLEGVRCDHLKSVISAFLNLGCKITQNNNSLRIIAPKRLKPIHYIKSLPYPDFPTDVGPLLIASLIVAKGNSVYCEGIFDNRFRYTDELKRMGADIRIDGKIAAIHGKDGLHGAHIECSDLRGGAALCIAALCADGISYIDNIKYIKRGYEKFCEKLQNVGADITTEEI